MADPLPDPAEPLSPAHRKAWLASTREQLFAPVHHLAESCHWLRDDAAASAGELLADLDRIRSNADKLRDLVDDLLGANPDPGEGGDFQGFRRRIGHDLRSPASIIIGTCELLREDAPAELLARFGSEIDRIRRLAERVVGSIGELVYYPFQQAGDVPVASLPGYESSLFTLPSSVLGPALRGRILLADDNPDNRELLSRWLQREDHTVVAVADGDAALAALRADSSFDLVLLDVLMPGRNGYQVLREIKADAALRSIPVVMISALGAMESVVRCIEMGADDFIPKPTNPVLLRARIHACLEKKQLRDREMALLGAIFPPELIAEYTSTSAIRPRRHDRVGVLFLDIVGFTPYCEARGDRPEEVVDLLQRHVLAFEESARRRGVQKIKTIGDAFMAVAGLLCDDPDPVGSLVNAGLDMIADSARLGVGWNVRVGINVGPVVAGVLGSDRFSYDLWGNTVNVASRLESASEPGRIALSEAAWAAIADRAEGERVERNVRGLGSTVVWVFLRWR